MLLTFYFLFTGKVAVKWMLVKAKSVAQIKALTGHSALFARRKTHKSSGTRRLTAPGISRIQQVVQDRKRYNDVANWDTIERLEHVNLSKIAKETTILNHKDCYTTFTSAQHISRLKAKFDKLSSSEIPNSSTQRNNQPALRSTVNSKLNTSSCIFLPKGIFKEDILICKA